MVRTTQAKHMAVEPHHGNPPRPPGPTVLCGNEPGEASESHEALGRQESREHAGAEDAK